MRRLLFCFLTLFCFSNGVVLAAFVDNDDGTVTDTQTGLMWQLETAPGTYYWQQALSYAEGLTLGGYSDWRLPSRNELQTLVDYSRNNPATHPQIAPYTVASGYWSSTTNAYYKGHAWSVHFYHGSSNELGKLSTHNVRVVRGNYSVSYDDSGILIINAYDLTTGRRITGASVVVDSQNGQTDGDGMIVFSELPAGTYSVQIAKDGYENYSTEVTLAQGDNVTIDCALTPITTTDLEVAVYNSKTGNPVSSASVEVGDQSGETDESGAVVFPGLRAGEYSVRIIKDGFAEYSKGIELTRKGTVRLNSGLSPIISVTHENPVVLDVKSPVSSSDQEAFFLDGVVFDPMVFTATVNWNGNTPQMVRFITPSEAFEESTAGTTASHQFDMGSDFGAGGRLQVVAVSSEGQESETFDANIEVMPSPIGWTGNTLTPTYSNTGYSYQGEHYIGLPVLGDTPTPSDMPLFGGVSFAFNAMAVASAVIGSDGIAEYSISRPYGSGIELGGVSFDSGWSFGGKIACRYSEEDNEWHIEDDASFLADVSVSKGLGPSYTTVAIGPVVLPVYLSGDIAVGAEIDVGVTGYSSEAGWAFNGAAEPFLGGKAVTGIGASGLLGVEGSLAAKGSFALGWPQEPTFREANIGLSGSISLVTFFYTYEQPLWEYTWSWPETSSLSSLRMSAQMPLDGDLKDQDWQPISRNYNGKGSAMATMEILSATTESLSGMATVQPLPGQTGIYPQSTPALIRNGDELMATWITDDLTKNDNNRTSLLYAIYSDGQWSTPGKVAEDGTADFYPALTAVTGGAVVAWQNTRIVLGADADLEQVMAHQEIAVSRYDDDAQEWNTSLTLTANDYLDRSPELSGSEDKAGLVWVANEQNNMLGTQDSPDTLMASFYDGTDWTTPAAIGTFSGAVLKSAYFYDGQNAVWVFSGDEDGDISTLEDQELYKIVYDGSAWSSIERLTEDSVQDTNPQLTLDADQNLVLIWYKDGDFVMAEQLNMGEIQTVLDRNVSSGATDFRLAAGDGGQLFLIWPDASDKGQDLFLSMYDPTMEMWGSGSQITNTDSMERSLAAVQTAEGALAILFNNVSMETETRSVQVGSDSFEVDVPISGAVDLSLAEVEISGDLSVDSTTMTFAPENLALGETVTIGETVTNAGLKPAENVSVEFYYGDPDDGGTVIGSRQIISGVLAAGASADVSVEWTLPNTVDAEKAIGVVVDPDFENIDADRTNNFAQRFVFEPDLKIDQMAWQAVGPIKRAITVSVVNNGTVPAENIPFAIHQTNETGIVLFEETLASLSVGESVDLFFEWDMSNVEGYAKAFASVNADQSIDEPSYLNNGRSIQVLGALVSATSNPSIVSGSYNISTTPVFAWDPASGATYYELYIWKEGENRPETPTVTGLTEPEYQMSPDQRLSALTAYHWLVVAKNEISAAESEEWSFTTTAAVIYVDADAQGANDGSSWSNAYTSLQDALDNAISNWQIWVASGTYKPTKAVGGIGERYQTFQMISSVGIYGGFAGDEDPETFSLNERDFAANETVLSGDFDGNDDFDDDQTLSDNAYHVFSHPDGTDLDDTAVLDGFTIRGGNADGDDSPDNFGGGMLNIGSSTLKVINCRIVGNSAEYGGGIYNHASSPSFSACVFAENRALEYGGGVLAEGGAATVFTNCLFVDNTARLGGALRQGHGLGASLTNCTLSGNTAGESGGGIHNAGTVNLANCILWDNSSGISGAQIHSWELGEATVTYSNIQDGYTGEGNINAEPVFVESGKHPLMLGSDSPCIGAGDPATTTDEAGETDLAGNERLVCTVDMGAYENQEPDSDCDGLFDAVEDANGNGIVDTGETDPTDSDTDNDGLDDGIEDTNKNGVVDAGETDPLNVDSDGDGLMDGEEDADKDGAVDAGETDPCNADTDGDQMPDGYEKQYNLDPLVSDGADDADGDGFSNFQEYSLGSNPQDPNSIPKSSAPNAKGLSAVFQLLLND